MSSFPLIIGTAAASAAVMASLAVPAVRRFAFGSIEQHWLCGELEFDRIDHDDQTIICKNDLYVQVFRINGLQFDTLALEVQQNMLKHRAALFFGLGELGITVRMLAVKRRADFSYRAEYPTPVLAEIGEKERTMYSSSYDLHWFMVLGHKNYGKLERGCEQVFTMLKDYQPTLLAGDDILGFVQYLLSGEYYPKASFPETRNISAAVSGSDIHFNRTSGIFETTTPEHHYNQILGVRAWTDMADGMMAGEIMALHGDIELCQILKPKGMDVARAELIASKQEQESFPSFIRNSSLLEEVTGILELVNDGQTHIFNTEYIIALRAKTPEDLKKLSRDVGDILSKRRIQWSIDTAVAPHYWFVRMPYQNRLTRPLRLLNQNIAALWTMHNSASGQRSSPWGDRPLRLFKSSIGKNYSFNFHTGDEENTAGHFLVFAPTGGGKSTLLMHLLGGLAKFPKVRSFIFDSKEGTRYMVEAMGGDYQNIENLHLNPFQCDDDPKNRLHLSRLLKQMGSASDNEINLLLNTIFNLPREQRILSNVFNYVFSETHSAAFADYQRWVTDQKGVVGNYGHVFNHDYDSLSDVLSGSFMTAINMADILNDDVLAPPLVSHIMQAISGQAETSNSGFCVFVDEAAALLRNKAFAEHLQIMFREYRKLKGVVGMAFQDPQALLDSGIADAVLNNTSTMIFFPNAEAKAETYKNFGLTPEQLQFITGTAGFKVRRGVLIVKRNAATGMNESIILDVDLSPYGDLLKWYRNGTTANKELKELKEQWGEDWRNHV